MPEGNDEARRGWVTLDEGFRQLKRRWMEDPLELLNDPEEARAHFTEAIEEQVEAGNVELTPEDIEDQVELAMETLEAIRRVFTLLEDAGHENLLADEDRDAFRDAVADLDKRLAKIVPWERMSVRALVIEPEHDDAEYDMRVGREQRLAPLPAVWLAAPTVMHEGQARYAWERLIEMLEETHFGQVAEYLVCPVCGRIQKRGRSDQIYCSGACRKAASRARDAERD